MQHQWPRGWGRLALLMQDQHRRAGSHLRDIKDSRDLAEWESALVAREERLEAREAALAGRADRERDLLVDADARDDAANVRDTVANQRDMAASVDELLEMPVDTAALRARALAATDRADSRHDRAASKMDRSNLTNDGPTPPA